MGLGKGPSFPGFQSGLLPWDHATLPRKKSGSGQLISLNKTVRCRGIFQTNIRKEGEKKKVQVNAKIYGPKHQKGKYGNSQRA